jgi:L-arabinose isomerase
MIVNEIEAIPIEKPMPRLPVARALWKPLPSLAGAAEAWIRAGGAHHSVYASALTVDYFRDWAEMMDIELAVIGRDTRPDRLADELRWAEAYWGGR